MSKIHFTKERAEACHFENVKIEYQKITKWKYRLTKDVELFIPIFGIRATIPGYAELFPDGRLIIFKGYCWDGCSGPTVDCKKSMAASLVHDVLYQMIRMGLLPPEYVYDADEIFHLLLLAAKMIAFRAWYYLKGVGTWIAHRSATPGRDQQPPIEVAP